MTDRNDIGVRVSVAVYMLNDVCRCHLYTNGGTCVRCTIVAEIKEHWPNEWATACCVYAESKSREQKEKK
jgi:hypothetical protein